MSKGAFTADDLTRRGFALVDGRWQKAAPAARGGPLPPPPAPITPARADAPRAGPPAPRPAPAPPAKASAGIGPAPGMNKTEARYAAHLEALRRAGSVARWDYEPERLRLAASTYYVPDFRVVLPDGAVEFHEVKGGFCRDDARVKVKVAARLHPYRFRMVRPAKGKGGGWTVEDFAEA